MARTLTISAPATADDMAALDALYPWEQVTVLLRVCSADITLVRPNGSTATWPAKTAGGADVPVGTYRVEELRRSTLSGTAATVTFSIQEVVGV